MATDDDPCRQREVGEAGKKNIENSDMPISSPTMLVPRQRAARAEEAIPGTQAATKP
jgi:hypothetical protein